MSSPSFYQCKHGDDPTVCEDCVALTNAQLRADQAEAERDRLRAVDHRVLDSLHRDDLMDLIHILRRDKAAVVAERDRLRAEKEEANVELNEFVGLITPLLHGTANAIKGEPPELVWHDWSDLPTVAAAVVAERDRLRAVVEAARAAFVRNSDDDWCIATDALVVLADALDALDGKVADG